MQTAPPPLPAGQAASPAASLAPDAHLGDGWDMPLWVTVGSDGVAGMPECALMRGSGGLQPQTRVSRRASTSAWGPLQALSKASDIPGPGPGKGSRAHCRKACPSPASALLTLRREGEPS